MTKTEITKTCPKCNKEGDIETFFGYRNMRHTDALGNETISTQPQSYCRECRKSKPQTTSKEEDTVPNTTPMLPTPLISLLQTGMTDFLQNAFWTSTKGFDGAIDRLIHKDHALFQGPFLSVKLPFRSTQSTTEFFPDVPMGFPPYLHQQNAFDRLSAHPPQHTIVATGTGSGKTECFTLPILNHCYQQRAQKGIKAIIIYPMNALATDQAKRLAKMIYQQPHLKESVRVGLFVGQQEKHPSQAMEPDKVITCKNTLTEYPPDILLTNYKMLDYLLARPQNQKIWHLNEPTTLQYLVVDELHTFDGAQGTDLACLIRRLKKRLNVAENHLCCVGTSATLGSENNEELIQYPNQIFGENFSKDSIITESRIHPYEFFYGTFIEPEATFKEEDISKLLPNDYTDTTEYLHAQMNLWFGHILPEQQLGVKLKEVALFRNLIELLSQGPVAVQEIAEERFFRRSQYSLALRKALITSLLSLASYARTPYYESPEKKAERKAKLESPPLGPFVQVQVQLWQRELRRIVANVTEQPELQFYDDLTIKEKRHHLPVIRCRDCGLMGWATVYNKDKFGDYNCNLKNFYQLFFDQDHRIRYLFPAGENIFHNRGRHQQTLKLHKLSLQHDSTAEDGNPDYVTVETGEHQVSIKNELKLDRRCPRCEGVETMLLVGYQAATLTATYINQLFSSPFNSDKKLLTFSDSVQDAAHRAGFFEAKTWRFNLRIAIQQALQQFENPPTLQELSTKVIEYWREKLGDDVFVATFIAPNMLWMNDYEKLLETGTLPPKSDIIDWISHRIRWEIHAEYSYQSRVGRSLPSMGASVAAVPSQLISAVTQTALEPIRELHNSFKPLTATMLRPFVQGLLAHMLQQGAIYQHGIADQYFETLGQQTFMTFSHPSKFWMPGRFRGQGLPIFLANHSSRHFEYIPSGTENTWMQDWIERSLKSKLVNIEVEGKKQLNLIVDATKEIFYEVLKALEFHNIVEKKGFRGHFVWGFHLEKIVVYQDTQQLRCSKDNHKITIPTEALSDWMDSPSLQKNSEGTYSIPVPDTHSYYTQMYNNGEVKRIVAREHTGLLKRDERETIEKEFKSDIDKPWFPNLLSCTPTLEMGIDIGDLSSSILCSVPPTQSNYLQRIGRAGRRDGNALILTIAGGKAHDLYFFSEPTEMLDGHVEAPGIFLDAAAVLQRQLTAYCFDNWARQNNPDALPSRLREVFYNLGSNEPDVSKFPYSLTSFIFQRQKELLAEFQVLFEGFVQPHTATELEAFILGEHEGDSKLARTILDALKEQHKNFQNLIEEFDRISKEAKVLSDKPVLDEQSKEDLRQLNMEKSAVGCLIKDIADKQTLAFFTDEGLLPNYAFPEAGVRLKSVIWRRKENKSKGDSNYDTFTYEFERPSRAAIRELAPYSQFYAGQRKVVVDRVDVRSSKPEEWQFCSECNYNIRKTGTEIPNNCPACDTEGFHDTNQTHHMLRLRQVYASTKDQDSRIGDESDERKSQFFNHRMMVQAQDRHITMSYATDSVSVPFGYEYLTKCTFREINFGYYSDQGQKSKIAHEESTRTGFNICNDCGHIQPPKEVDKRKRHTLSCPALTQRNYKEHITDCLFLYREFDSEAIRFLLPFIHEEGSHKRMHSFLAALQMGLRLRYKGKVDHLESTIYTEPDPLTHEHRVILALYDTIPGGTGYLKDICNPKTLFDIFTLALSRLVNCSCNHDENKDGCYRCLYAYQGSSDRNEVSRDIAVSVLNDVLAVWENLVPDKRLNTLSVSGLLESVLEEQFIHGLPDARVDDIQPKLENSIINGVKSGYTLILGSERHQQYKIEPQVNIGQQQGIKPDMRADFEFTNRDGGKPIIVFTDGLAFHYKTITKDMMQRMGLNKSGRYRSWSLTHWDVNDSPDFSILDWIALLPPQIRSKYIEQLSQNPAQRTLSKAHAENNLQLLIRYLALENADEHLYALAETYLFILLRTATPCIDWQSKLSEIAPQSLIDAMAGVGVPTRVVELTLDPHLGKYLRLIFGMWETQQDGKRHRSYHGVLHIKDKDIDPNDPKFKIAWHAYLRFYNLFQVVSGLFFTTETGACTEDFGHLIESVYRTDEDSSLPSEWKTLLHDEDFADYHGFLRNIYALGIPCPNLDGAPLTHNDIETEIPEMIWEDQKVVLFTEDSEEQKTDSNIAQKLGYKAGLIEHYLAEPHALKSLF